MQHTATYSPDDNKLRLYPAFRLSKDDYERMRAAGFKWAPKQELFVAPTWAPDREDLLLEMCGEIGDEDKSLVERAEERADRFEDYSEKRANDAERAHAAVKTIADGIPLGQPILVGHHSEKRARKDAERIENGMRRAVKMWETSEYWTYRAAGAMRHAKYKERPDVRARRIKKIEAEKRKTERNRAEALAWLQLWTAEGLALEQARAIASRCWLTVVRDGTHNWTAWNVLSPDEERYKSCPAWTVEQVQAVARRVYPATIASCDRWLAHYNNRLAYERAMLDDAGGTVADRNKPEKGGAVKCWANRGHWLEIQKVNKVSVSVLDNWGNGRPDFLRTVRFDELHAVISKAEWDAMKAGGERTGRAPGRQDREHAAAVAAAQERKKQPELAADFEAMREQLRNGGVQVVSAPQLFPTPPDLAARMVELAQIQPEHRVLEPSAGTANIIKAIRKALPTVQGEGPKIVAVEINRNLAGALSALHSREEIICKDFLQCNGDLGTFDRILMNPPFANAEDIKHIEHAVHMLKPGGRLVAICANGPRQNERLRPMVEASGGEWHPLPAGAFADSGTNVNAALIVLDA